MKLLVRLFFISACLVSPLLAQELQNRSIVHLQTDMNKQWFVPVWSVTNIKSRSPNNTNLFSGIGYRQKTWWLESMVQHQWNGKANQFMLDFRFDKQSGPWHAYAEASPFLTNPKFYEFVILERKIGKGWSVGGETENVHQSGKDVFAIGPRTGHKLVTWSGLDVGLSGTFRINPVNSRTEALLYLVFNRRLHKKQ